MVSILSSKALQVVQKLPFCYLCGKIFLEGDEVDKDHVPSKSCISQKDKAHSPIILQTHKNCNGGLSESDERVGQFLSILHGKVARPERRRLKYERFSSEFLRNKGASHDAVTNVSMYGVVERWVRAFHACLYLQPLSQYLKFAIELPFDVLIKNEVGYFVDNGRYRQRALCEETISHNRLSNNLDRIVAWNGCLKYECVWTLTPLHAYCVFWLDFYGWSRLAKLNGHKPKECYGIYALALSEVPVHAAIESGLVTMSRSFRFSM